MDLFPAIDLMGGQVVRLAEGDRDAVTVYESDPVRMVHTFADAGATWIHMVDLDGAFAGAPQQTALRATQSVLSTGRHLARNGWTTRC